MTITEEQVNAAFDAYLECFNDLAAQEDILDDMKLDLMSYKEGSVKFIEAEMKIKQFEREMSVYQRNIRKAALHLDRIKTLVMVQKGC